MASFEHRDVAGPTDARPPYRFAASERVAFSDTDAQGIVYYGRYAPYFDLARVEYLRHLGLLRERVQDEHGEFVMRRFEIDYHAPAEFDDLLVIYARVTRIGTSSMTFSYLVEKADDGRHLAESNQVMVYVDLEQRRPLRVPDVYRDAVAQFEES